MSVLLYRHPVNLMPIAPTQTAPMSVIARLGTLVMDSLNAQVSTIGEKMFADLFVFTTLRFAFLFLQV